ncbi:MAG: penicillin-binding protein activator [candidate division KSB1 bacterium]|jgi:ABC-type branched-subunit amino acid transport system substrate-binding protein|nr:penicillin-binding protein activator [candidate division KSB1 bacterium]
MKIKIYFTLIILSISLSAAFPQEDNRTELLFKTGIQEFESGNYIKAEEIFSSLVENMPAHARITISQLMWGKTLYQLGNYSSAINVLEEMVSRYPDSDYIDDARYTLGNCYYRLKKYNSSVREFLWLTDHSKSKTFQENGRKLSLQIIESNLSMKEIERLHAEMKGESSSALLTIKLAQRLGHSGKKEKAISILNTFTKEKPKNPYNTIIREVIRNLKSDQTQVDIKVGVILPLSSQFTEQAEGVLAGIQFAQMEYNDKASQKIDLIIQDTEGSIMRCIKLTRNMVQDDRVISIIGELESEITASVAPIADVHAIPVIPPLAAENGLAALSDYIFQVNGDLSQRGRYLAEYAVKEKGHKTFATLSPADNYGKEITDAFTETVDRLGGEIVAQKWYYENTQDLARQFESIRELGFKRMNKDSLIEAYTEDMTDFQKSRFREEVIPVTSIDGIFMPVYTEDIQYVIPQFAYANISAQIFGGQYWYEIDELRKKNVAAHVEDIIFISDFYLDDFRSDFQAFKTRFRKAMGKTPGVMALAGYDAFSLIASAVRNKAMTREEVRDYLDDLANFKAKRGTITFRNNERVNSGQRIISFKNGRFQLME